MLKYLFDASNSNLKEEDYTIFVGNIFKGKLFFFFFFFFYFTNSKFQIGLFKFTLINKYFN